MTTNRVARGKPRGRPFPKGVSPNPGGIPSKNPVLIAERYSIRDVVNSKIEEALPQLVAELVTIAQTSQSDKIRVMAIEVLMNRRLGKPRESVEIKTALPHVIEIVYPGREQLQLPQEAEKAG